MRLKLSRFRRNFNKDLPIEFTEQNLSSFGGLELFSRYLRRVELSRRVGNFGASVSGSLTTSGAGSPSRPRLWAARRWPRLRPLPHPLRFCVGTAASSQPSTMAARTGVVAPLLAESEICLSWWPGSESR